MKNELSFAEDTVSGYISIAEYPLIQEKMSFRAFLNFYEFECSPHAKNADLDELKGGEVIKNLINDRLYPKNNLDTEINFSIFNANGQFISKGRIAANSILEKEVYDLNQGVYFIRIDDGIGPKFTKILKL